MSSNKPGLNEQFFYDNFYVTNIQVYLSRTVDSWQSQYLSRVQSLVCVLVMSFLGQQTEIRRKEAEVLNIILINIFATFYVTNSLHKQFFACDNFNLSHKS